MIKLVRRFIAHRRGVAAIEFAIIAPVLILILVSTFDIGVAAAIYMKVRSATYTLAAVTNTYTTGANNSIQSADMTNITGSTAKVLAPYSGSPVTATITQLVLSSATQAKVSWSYSLNGTAYAQGVTWTRLPSQLTSTNACNSYPCYLIFAEVSYQYTPLLFSSLIGSLTLGDNLYMTPRSSPCIQYLGVPSAC
jgi:Flp pilus assembly protein TadG